jgi:hypothetical protein
MAHRRVPRRPREDSSPRETCGGCISSRTLARFRRLRSHCVNEAGQYAEQLGGGARRVLIRRERYVDAVPWWLHLRIRGANQRPFATTKGAKEGAEGDLSAPNAAPFWPEFERTRTPPQDGRTEGDGLLGHPGTDRASDLDIDRSDVPDLPWTSDEALSLRLALKEGDHERLEAVLALLCRRRPKRHVQVGAA